MDTDGWLNKLDIVIKRIFGEYVSATKTQNIARQKK